MVNAIAEACGIEICAKKGLDYSFFSSPYQAHRDHVAVDICAGKEFGCDAYSPVSGEVIKVLSFESPTPTGIALPEHLIIIKKGKYAARIMHVAPKVNVGEQIAAGDVIGRTIANGFFSYWVDPIMHVEIRKENDYIRARGGCELAPLRIIEKASFREKHDMGGTVECASDHNVKIRLKEMPSFRVGDVPAQPDGTLNLDYSGVYGRFTPGEKVYLNGIKMGEIIRAGKYFSTYRTMPLQINVNDSRYEGISFSNDPLTVRLLPKKYGPSGLKPGDGVRIRLSDI
ncbi:MAG: hypothetical protein WAX07_08225 [Candidatus Altiarchaeia archaeon]